MRMIRGDTDTEAHTRAWYEDHEQKEGAKKKEYAPDWDLPDRMMDIKTLPREV